jgi:predicted dehydrogenase
MTASGSSSQINLAVVGLQFGNAFVPIYQRHPNVARVAVCDLDPQRLNTVSERFGIPEGDRYSRLEDILADDTWDAVHILTPVRFHAEQVQAVLNAGKHCACAVPMATRGEDLRAIITAQRRTSKNYMMMETAVYTREFLHVRQLREEGTLGNLTFLRGAHIQDIEGLPDYWKGYPPMHYITHALSPLLALAGTRAAKVSCFGSGTLRPDLRQTGAPDGGNPFPLETAIFRLAGTNLAAEVTMSFFQTARPYTESFSVYGDRMGFEWPQSEAEDGLLFRLEELPPGRRGRPVTAERVRAPFRPDLLPPEIAEFTVNGGHGGSHPHLVHEFVRSIVEGRPPAIDAVTAANWTAPGLYAHASALRDGETLVVPDFTA